MLISVITKVSIIMGKYKHTLLLNERASLLLKLLSVQAQVSMSEIVTLALEVLEHVISDESASKSIGSKLNQQNRAKLEKLVAVVRGHAGRN